MCVYEATNFEVMSHGDNPTTAELSPCEGDHMASRGESVKHVFSVHLQRRLEEDSIGAHLSRTERAGASPQRPETPDLCVHRERHPGHFRRLSPAHRGAQVYLSGRTSSGVTDWLSDEPRTSIHFPLDLQTPRPGPAPAPESPAPVAPGPAPGPLLGAARVIGPESLGRRLGAGGRFGPVRCEGRPEAGSPEEN